MVHITTQDLMVECQLKHMMNSTCYPENNGLAEREVQIIKNMWRRDADNNGTTLAYRTMSIKRPEELLMG